MPEGGAWACWAPMRCQRSAAYHLQLIEDTRHDEGRAYQHQRHVEAGAVQLQLHGLVVAAHVRDEERGRGLEQARHLHDAQDAEK